jgi:RsiW-degrading membrane proteinase PrsW (M82 family)
MALLRWLLPALLPVALFVALARRATLGRKRSWLLPLTFVLAAAASFVAAFAIGRAASLTGLSVRVADAGDRGALLFVFLVVAPIQEAAKVAAVWPAFLAKRAFPTFDGVVYAAAAALGFSAVEAALVLRTSAGGIDFARLAMALPAHVFFAGLWGLALARAKRSRQRAPIFPAAFVSAVVVHGLYLHFAFGRGPGALLADAPLLAVMGLVAWVVLRDIGDDVGPPSSRMPISSGRAWRLAMAQPPSLATVRRALQQADEPIKIGWVLFGALVTIGAMVAGITSAAVAAHFLRVDLSTIDERNVVSASPVLLLGVGLLLSFPASGWLVARAAKVRTLLEPALATVLALLVTVVALGLAAPVTVVFALALSPIAWVLACVGAWMGSEA